ncbi:MAG: DNA cytosine methyltransferase [Dermatophilaceae bacterium]|nr:DNA cytosine methyltransferase [Intrasporangiaceae bacterium]
MRKVVRTPGPLAPTLGGLFSGIGGFELSWIRNGGRVAWMCEIDPAARKVLEARFPGVPIYADVMELDPAEVEAVDVVSGGSPCQGFSIAGGRKGMEHIESRLFADYVRIVDGLAERGLKFALWENVPGVLSIKNDTGERTFPHVIGALAGSPDPVELREYHYGPRGGKKRIRWNTGLVARGSRAVAWRVLDSRHFGVPQRRRRVYACVAFGGAAADRAFRALLALPEGVRGDTAACGQEGQGVAGSSGGGSEGGFSIVGHGEYKPGTGTLRATGGDAGGGSEILTVDGVPDTARCLTTGGPSGQRMDATTETLVPGVIATAHAMGFYPTGGTHGVSAVSEGVPAIKAGSGIGIPSAPAVLVPRGISENRPSRPSNVIIATSSASDVLTSEGYTQPVTGRNGDPGSVLVPQAIAENQRGEVVTTDDAHAVTSGGGKPGQGYPAVMEPFSFDRANVTSKLNQTRVGPGLPVNTLAETNDVNVVVPYGVHGEHSSAMNSGGDAKVMYPIDAARCLDTTGGYASNQGGTVLHTPQYGVRRLTPTECERLQGFPDGWTELAGSDSSRYKALGNAVTVNVPQWIFARMLAEPPKKRKIVVRRKS